MSFKKINFKQLVSGLKMMNRSTWLVLVTGLFSFSVFLICSALITKSSETLNTLNTPNIHEQKVIHESDLNTVQLTEDSYRKLGIETSPVKRGRIKASKTYGGEIVVPTGGKISVSAPISGKLVSIQHSALLPGTHVNAGQLLYRIQPLLTADARANMVNALADAESLMNTSKSQVDAAYIALKRAKKLLDELVGSQRNVDEASAAHEIALRNLEAATAKREVLNQVVNIGTVAPIEIKAPKSGIISNILAVPDQLLSTGNPIIEISELDTLWVRVPIPVGELDEIDQHAEAKITKLSSPSGAPYLTAKPVIAPPSADPMTGSAHIFYAISNKQSNYIPAQRVSASLSTVNKQQDAVTVPWSAIIFDVYGGSWVYTQTSATVFERKRVFLEYVNGSEAVISEGPKDGAKIVVNGALELFGVETGFAH